MIGAMTNLPGPVGFASPVSTKRIRRCRLLGIELFATVALAVSLLIAATAVSIGVARASLCRFQPRRPRAGRGRAVRRRGDGRHGRLDRHHLRRTISTRLKAKALNFDRAAPSIELCNYCLRPILG